MSLSSSSNPPTSLLPPCSSLKLRKNKNGGKAVYLNAGDNKKLYVQLPFLRSPYGLSAYTDEATGRTSYSLDLSFDPDNAEAMALHAKLTELDEIIVNTVAKNAKEWLWQGIQRGGPKGGTV